MNIDELNPILKEHGARIGVPHDDIKHYAGPIEHVSDEEAVRRDHGVGIGVPHDDIKHYAGPIEHVSDEEAVRRDHGVGIGVPHDNIKHYAGPIEHVSDEEAVRRDHGVGIGIKASGLDTYGTEDKELQKVFQELLYADGVGKIDSVISKLPDSALVKLIEQRYRKSANKLDDKGLYNKEGIICIGKSLDVDFAIIMTAIQHQRDIFEPVFDASHLMGEENKTNVLGLVDAYKSSLEQVPFDIELIDGMTGKKHIDNNTGKVLDAQTGLEYINEEAKKVAIAKGVDVNNMQK